MNDKKLLAFNYKTNITKQRENRKKRWVRINLRTLVEGPGHFGGGWVQWLNKTINNNIVNITYINICIFK